MLVRRVPMVDRQQFLHVVAVDGVAVPVQHPGDFPLRGQDRHDFSQGLGGLAAQRLLISSNSTAIVRS
jgi:hypothetical protein